MSNPASKPVIILSEDDVEKRLAKEMSSQLAADLLLIPRDGSDANTLPFDWSKAKEYYVKYCAQGGGNDCPDGDFPLDCTHFVGHGLSRSKIIVNQPSVICASGVCVRVAELAAAFKNSVGKYSNVKKIGDIDSTREGDFCFVVSWFGLSTDHAMVLADTITLSGGKVFGHTNARCGEMVDLSGQSLVVYRID
jgi:hypothetical protein